MVLLLPFEPSLPGSSNLSSLPPLQDIVIQGIGIQDEGALSEGHEVLMPYKHWYVEVPHCDSIYMTADLHTVDEAAAQGVLASRSICPAPERRQHVARLPNLHTHAC